MSSVLRDLIDHHIWANDRLFGFCESLRQRRWHSPDDHRFSYRTRQGDEECTSVSFSVVQMLDHGSEHRAHIRTILSTHGLTPPEIDGWAWDDER